MYSDLSLLILVSPAISFSSYFVLLIYAMSQIGEDYMFLTALDNTPYDTLICESDLLLASNCSRN